MRYELYLARRYAFSRKRENFITIISSISMVGIMVGTGALIMVLSVFNGFSSVVTQILVSFDPHVRVTAKEHVMDSLPPIMSSPREVEQKIRGLEAFESEAPVVR